MQAQDDLASLFSRNLSLNPSASTNSTPEGQIFQTSSPDQSITYSITQHYHHSGHLVSNRASRPSSEPPVTDQETTEIILNRHGVDVTTLFPAQIELFKSAEPSQKMRLVELWRISPPNLGGHALHQDLGATTTFDQEEALAKLRYERQMLEERASRNQGVDDQQLEVDDMMSDGEQSNAPITPIQSADGRWPGVFHAPEPYMASGYEALAQREYEASAQLPAKDTYSHFGTAIGGPTYTPATDPVYNNNHQTHVQESWARSPEEQQRAMENQYGIFAHHRQYSAGVLEAWDGRDEEML